MSKKVKEAFDNLVKYSLDKIERDRGEHIYFETNPADPTLPHMMHNVNNAKLEEFMWLKHWFGSCVPETTKGARMLTKEEAEKIISAAVPTSQHWSETHKQIICSFIPCPCCAMISMIVKVMCQGQPSDKKDDVKVSGWYRVDISAVKGGKFEVETRRLEFEKEPLLKQVVEI
jgi:hypothetical protein